jgi:DNA-binding transcriptional regulator YdaS (Cro superfamily)
LQRKSSDRRWESKFASFVAGYGIDLLAARLHVTRSAVYHWMHGVNSLHPANALAICRLAKRRHIELTLDDIYDHFRAVDSKCFRTTASTARTE